MTRINTFTGENKRVIALAGVIWGIIEATLGWVIHLTHLKGLTLILISIGAFAMMYAVIKTRKASSAFIVSGIAASIKLLDLLLVGAVPIFWVLHPTLHILLEGILVSVVCWKITPQRVVTYTQKYINK